MIFIILKIDIPFHIEIFKIFFKFLDQSHV
jgi:hypothetical protein